MDTEDGTYTKGYFETRLTENPNRAQVWEHLTAYLQERWIPADAAVLELGAGWCDFSNQLKVARSVAMDLDATVQRAAAPTVDARVGDCTDLSRFGDAEFDVVFASNLLEHLERPRANALVGEAMRVLRPGGILMLMQPNFRLQPRRYFDDFTHVSIFTDVSMHDYLVSRGFADVEVRARFMPFSMKSGSSKLSFLVPWYLRSPVKPMAGQMLAVAHKPA